MKLQDALDQLARETARARRRLTLERAARAWLPFALAVGAWAAIALSGAFDLLPLAAQSIGVTVALCAFVWLGWRAQRGWRPPTQAEARQRLIADSALEPGAFEALDDRPSRFDAHGVALWRREQQHARERVAKARAGPPRPLLNEVDPLRLRFVVPVLLLGTLILAGASAPDRLAEAFLPDPGPLLGDGPMQVEAWVTPADYTHAEPVSLSDRLGQRIETPPSVEATVRVTGPTGAPRLVFEGQGGRRETRFVQAADGAWEAHLAIPGPGRLKIVRFHTRGFWRIAPAQDLPPRALFAAPLTTLSEQRVTVAWSAEDDYGVRRMALRLRPIHPPEGLRGAAPLDVTFESPAGDPKSAEGESQLELATNAYAGMEVEAHVVAFDATGQAGESPALRFTMPEKIFLQPLARAAIEIRRAVLLERRPYANGEAAARRSVPMGDTLLGNQRIEIRDYDAHPAIRRAPPGIRYASRLIDALTMAPQDGYFRDLAIYIGLRKAQAELEVARGIDDTDAAADTLWRTALRAEYGGSADARRALEEAQHALDEALAAHAPQNRIRDLVQALRDATNRYMQALVQEAIRRSQTQQTQEDTQDQAQITQQDIDNMLDQAQRLSEQGRNADAQDVLQRQAQILNNLDVRLGQTQQQEEQRQQQSQQGQQAQQNDAQDQQQQQDSGDLSQTIEAQRQLQQQTAEQQRQAEGGGGGDHQGGAGGGGDQLAQRQAQIRQALGQAAQMPGASDAQASNDLSAAARAMQQSEDALRRGDFNAARAAQDSALQSLRDGADRMADAAREDGTGDPQTGAGGPRDPLGRRVNGAGDGDGDTQVPTQIDPARVRDIVNEIRRRAEDPNRPEAERDYLRRLLDRFSNP